ncbi:ComEA family DNA-binding protein [Haloechinothrix sp. YIM 98757]|uniref:ComEA family DNA-binding protein n=2 Tax=Haloechinothrix aidingensis TaxID=2752311 RepID=A0A838AAS8_9PSEU|nr:ComEA family DNA-binding protein [Haloechinothrix aidingensis]
MPGRLALLVSRWATRSRQRWIPSGSRERNGDRAGQAPGGSGSADAEPPRSRPRRPSVLVVLLPVVAVAGALSVTAWALSGGQERQEHVPAHVESRPGESGPGEVGPGEVVGDGPAEVVPTSPARTPEDRDARAGGDEPRDGAADLVISVVGEVAEPGLVTVPAGSRVADAVAAAGGEEAGADLMDINLARQLTDGEQIYVGVPTPPGMGPEPSAPGRRTAGQESGPVHLNGASTAGLETLPGVGEVTAGRIVEWRERHGEFTTVEQLREVQGIGESTLDSLRDRVTVE